MAARPATSPPYRWRPSRRTVQAVLLAASFAVVLDRGTYWRFDRVRIKVVPTEQTAVGTTLEVPLRDLSALDGQPLALVLRLRREAADPVRVTVTIDGHPIGTATVVPGPPVRVDLGAGAEVAGARPRRLVLEADRAGAGVTLRGPALSQRVRDLPRVCVRARLHDRGG